MPLEISHTSSRQFLPFGRLITEEAHATLRPHALSLLVDYIVQALLPLDALRLQTVIDMKGGDPPGGPGLFPHAPVPNELLYVEGHFPLFDKHQKASTEEDFSLRLTTEFLEFEGARHIRYSIHLDQHGAITDIIPAAKLLQKLGKAFPVTIRRVRLALDLFEPHFFSFFGFSPVATQHILIEATEHEVHVRLVREGAPDSDSLPLKDSARYRQVREELERIAA
jgi:hypothetical protein